MKRFSEKEILPAERPQNDSRYVPQVLQREVFKRDEGRCSYVSPEGKSCGEKNFLELDHIHPFALGGETAEENLRLLCRAHNQWRAEKTFGVVLR
ncbi:MAG: HNH endonuclease [Deltaproteobacteria bacterium]|nr:HNH endonuclease [Deltaproteobacteria bacterium]